MDPHAPYLPPTPFDRLFYDGNEHDPNNHSLDPVLTFRPFADFFRSWFPSGVTDSRYIDAQYDGAIAYLDVAIDVILNALRARGVLDESVVVLASDHGETLYEHECFYDHHGLYDSNLRVPFIIRYPVAVPAGFRYAGMTEVQDVMPTVLDLLGIPAEDLGMTGKNLAPAWRGEAIVHREALYLTEATWMRKQGWRTAEWKLIRALEPDFHFKPPVELYDLVHDPGETHNLAERRPDVVADLTDRLEAWVSRRVAETGRPSPIEKATRWHGLDRGPFQSSQEAYDTLHIGSIAGAQRIQDRAREAEEEETP
jgi:arylsulfatase A-like enzyme